ncbi:hypothetical protein F4861DRAFT_513338 [Xylaria intraflava]|nr:hypothetical protein F4861DRAFT_513338 [Xylaria intraflava]
MVGMGEPTVSRTLAHGCFKSGWPALSLFFKRDSQSRKGGHFTTIAAQLAWRGAALTPHVRETIDFNSALFGGFWHGSRAIQAR